MWLHRWKARTWQLATLASLVAETTSTLNAYRPLPGKGYATFLIFGCGSIVSELPLQVMAGQAGVLALASPKLSPRLRLAAWLVSGLSWSALLGLHRAGHRANVPLAGALDAALGTGRRTDSNGLSRPPYSATVKSPGVLRTLRAHRYYVHAADISYGPFGRANQLDIWRRPDCAEGAPVLLQVPGGAWTVGNKRGQAYPLMSHLAELGWICVAINYRLSPRNTWPDHIIDVKRAIAWVKANIADYGGDPDFVAITGGSAGGHLSSLAALTPNDPQFQPDFADVDTRVQAAVPFYGLYDFTRADDSLHPQLIPMMEQVVMKRRRSRFPDLYRSMSPITYVGPDAPPFFVLHGHNDTLVPVQQARAFVTRLREVSEQPVAYAELPLAQHAFEILGSARATRAAVAVGQFLAEIYSRIYSRSAVSPTRGSLDARLPQSP